MSRITLSKNAGRSDEAPRVVHTVVFGAGKSVSSEFYLGAEVVEGIVVPAGWTTADIAFEASVDGQTWYAVKSDQGTALRTKVTGAGYYAVPSGLAQALFCRLNSVGESAAVNQVSAVTLAVVAAQ